MKIKKISIQFLALAFLVSLTVAISGCGEGKTDKEKNMEFLTSGGAWKVISATVDGVDETEVYKDLQLTFLKSQYTSVNGRPIWQENGIWGFTNESGTEINVDGNKTMVIASLTSTTLVLTFTWTEDTLGGGRTKSVSGEHVMTFTR